ncbi:rhomboid family intramembrane serine protease [soil metagenome]
MTPLPPVTKYLLWAIAIVFLLQNMQEALFIRWFALWPWGSFPDADGSTYGFQPWQLLTYAFLHGSLPHLFFNGIVLFQFGPRIEYALGQQRYLIFVLVCAAGAAVSHLLVTGMMISNGAAPFPTVGASGFIYGILMAYALMFPKDRLQLLLPPIELSARTLVLVMGGIELFLGVTGTASGIAHFAHLGGMLFGWLMLRYWRGQPPFNKRKPPPPKLRSVN